MKQTETIAAIATALSDSGCHSLKDYGSHTIHYGFIVDGEEILDEVMVSVMRAPKTYTREDTVEINCHGGILIMRRILEAALANGARLAEPGEFTKRAFLNGRIDLAKAEAVMDLIRSRNDYARKASFSQLEGSVSERIRGIRQEILTELAFIESALDDPEHISTEGYPEKLSAKVDGLIAECRRLIESAENGRLLREGISTVIVGKPNAGKSSLLNFLAGRERAIVTDIAGTTRDALEEAVSLNGISLNVIDTAGIRSTSDLVEQMGVEKAEQYAKEADLLLYMADSSVPLDESDERILKLIRGRKCIALLNKSDLATVLSEEELKEKLPQGVPVVRVSVKENQGLDEFGRVLTELFFEGKLGFNEEVVITSMRHKEALMAARDSLLEVKKSLEAGMPEDFFSIDLMSAYASLGEIIGEEVGEDLVNEIFSKFCMGK